MEKQKITILGSTGSIGRSCLPIIERNPNRYEVFGLACGENVDMLNEQIEKYSPKYVFCKYPKKVKGNVVVLSSLQELAGQEGADAVLFATVGFSAAEAVIAAIQKKKKILLANKETLVCAGSIIMPLAKKYGVSILPVDSEHSAIFQASQGKCNEKIKRIILTASGGAFRDYDESQLKNVTHRDALKHPNWNMGAKITIDCASMVNKALEVIEAHWLFGLDYNQIETALHRQSIVHSIVEFCDNSCLAQMSNPSMEIPISLALSYPERLECLLPPLNFETLQQLTFEKIDTVKFPCFSLVVAAGKQGGTMPTVANAANEQVVEAFLKDKIAFNRFAEVIDSTMSKCKNIKNPSLDDILLCDKESREIAKNIIKCTR